MPVNLRHRSEFKKLKLKIDPFEYCGRDECSFLKSFFTEVAFIKFDE